MFWHRHVWSHLRPKGAPSYDDFLVLNTVFWLSGMDTALGHLGFATGPGQIAVQLVLAAQCYNPD